MVVNHYLSHNNCLMMVNKQYFDIGQCFFHCRTAGFTPKFLKNHGVRPKNDISKIAIQTLPGPINGREHNFFLYPMARAGEIAVFLYRLKFVCYRSAVFTPEILRKSRNKTENKNF